MHKKFSFKSSLDVLSIFCQTWTRALSLPAHTPRWHDCGIIPVIVVALRGHRAITHSATHPIIIFCCPIGGALACLIGACLIGEILKRNEYPQAKRRASIQEVNRVACACAFLDCADSCYCTGLPSRNHQAADEKKSRGGEPANASMGLGVTLAMHTPWSTRPQ